MRNFALVALAITLAATTTPAAARLVVIPRDYPTIQMGIDNTVDGDDIAILAGTYVENLNIAHGLTIGAPFGGVTIQAADPVLPACLVHDTGPLQGVTLLNLEFIGSRQNDALETAAAKDVWVQDCTLVAPGAYFSGLSVNEGSWVHAEGIRVEGNTLTASDSVVGLQMAPCN